MSRPSLLLRAALLVCVLSASAPLAAEPQGGSSGVKLPTVVKWMLQGSQPCPNCDAVQTWVGRKPTPLPSPLPPGGKQDARTTERADPTSAAAPNPLDQVTWEQWRVLLPAGLRGK